MKTWQLTIFCFIALSSCKPKDGQISELKNTNEGLLKFQCKKGFGDFDVVDQVVVNLQTFRLTLKTDKSVYEGSYVKSTTASKPGALTYSLLYPTSKSASPYDIYANQMNLTVEPNGKAYLSIVRSGNVSPRLGPGDSSVECDKMPL